MHRDILGPTIKIRIDDHVKTIEYLTEAFGAVLEQCLTELFAAQNRILSNAAEAITCLCDRLFEGEQGHTILRLETIVIGSLNRFCGGIRQKH